MQKEPVSFYLPSNIVDAMHRHRDETGRPMSQTVALVMRAWLDGKVHIKGLAKPGSHVAVRD